MKLIDQNLQRPIVGSVVDDDHFVFRIFQLQHGARTLRDAQLLVVGWSDDGYRRHQSGLKQRIPFHRSLGGALRAQNEIAESHQHEIVEVADERINDDDVQNDIDDVVESEHALSSL